MLPNAERYSTLRSTLSDELILLAPELLIVVSIALMLLARLSRTWDRVHLHQLALVPILCSLGLLILQWLDLFDGSPGATLFSGFLHFDGLANFGRTFLVLFAAVSLLTCLKTQLPDAEDSADFGTLFLGATLGLMLLCSANHLMMLFIALEMASLPSYALAGFMKGQRRGSEAALKYALFGAAAAGITLYGISLVVLQFQTGHLPELTQQLAKAIEAGHSVSLGLAGAALVLIGLAFKLSLVPVHFWCPDVFEGAIAEVGGFLSVASKAGAMILTCRWLFSLSAWQPTLSPEVSLAAITWVLLILAALSMTWGNLCALWQMNLKRLLAYSTIAHAGTMTLALATQSTESGQALLYYLAAYFPANLGAFAFVAFLRKTKGREDTNACQGLFRTEPLLATTGVIFFASLLGLPPLAGFAAKFQVFIATYHGGIRAWSFGQGALAWAFWLAVAVGVINTVISAGYYLNLVRLMILEEPDSSESSRTPIGTTGSLILGVLAMMVLILGLAWNWVTALTALAFPLPS